MFRNFFKSSGLLALVMLVAYLTPRTACAMNTEQLSFLLFHERYPVRQGYLTYWSGNKTWDKRHAGYDFGTGSGKTIYAPISGRCINAGGSLGYCSIYNSSLNRTVIVLHLSVVNVAIGDDVVIGQVLGLTGDKGVPGQPHAHIECRPGEKPQAVGNLVRKSTASQTMNPLTAFANLSVEGTVDLQRILLDVSDPDNWYQVFDLEYFGPGELTALAKCYNGLDADLWWYSLEDEIWYPLSEAAGNEFVHMTFGSGYSNDHYPIYIAVVAYSGRGGCDFLWHSSQSAP